MASKKNRLIAELKLALVATLGLTIGLGGLVQGQDKAVQAKVAPAPKAHMPVVSGFTRPGDPGDEVTKDGKIRPLALVQDGKKKIIGGTVYFSVFENVSIGTRDDGDFWGTGMGNLPDLFVHGYSIRGKASPNFDTRAKYLYLYQIVNDRGLDRAKSDGVAPAIEERKVDLHTTDIAGWALRLSVDPRYITSWGHFKTAAFTAHLPNRNLGGDIVPVVDGSGDKIALAVSSYQPILSELPAKKYLPHSPAYPLPTNMISTWGVGSATLNLKMAEDHRQLAKLQADGVKLVGYETNKLGAAVAARTPDYVQVLFAESDERHQAMVTDEFGSVVFRADFIKALKPGEHTVVFGFTSDLPPQDEPVRIEEQLAVAGGIKAVVGGAEGVAPAVGTGVGTGVGAGVVAGVAAAVGVAPGPIPPVAQGGFGGALGTLGGISGGGGGGGGFGFPGAVGAIGAARPATAGGGGFGGGGGRGNTEGSGNQNQNQNPSVNFNATLTNQQQQQQQQSQNQNQSNGGGCCGGGNVVPEPGSVILALLGTPGLVWFWRRKTS